MPIYSIQAPDGKTYEIEGPPGATQAQVIQAVLRQNPEAGTPPPPPEGGFLPAFKAGVQNILGQGALTAGKAGLIDTQTAEKFAAERRAKADSIFQPTQDSFMESPLQNTKELLGSSLPYAVAPIAAAGTAAVAGAPALAAAGVGGLASLAQFTGTNLDRQMQEKGVSLEGASGEKAVMAAVPQAALDTIGFRFIPGIGKLFGAAGEKVTTDTARALAAQTAKQIAADYAKATGRAITAEGLTEAMQQVLERAQADMSLTDDSAKSEYLQSLFGGALLGGVMAPMGRFQERGSMKRESKQLTAEQSRAAAEKERLDAAAGQTRLDTLALEGERDAPTAQQPYTRGDVAQPELPGFETVDRPQAAPAVEQPTQLLERRRVLEQQLEQNQQAMSEASTAKDFDALERLDAQRAQIEDVVGKIDADVQASGYVDTTGQQAEIEKQLATVETRLAKMNGPGTDPAKVRTLLGKRRELRAQLQNAGGSQPALDLGKPKALSDPAENYRYHQEQQARQQAQMTAQELAQQNELLGQQKPGPDDTRMDMFKESMAQVEAQRATGETNFDYLDPIFEKAFAGDKTPPAVAAPEGVQPAPNARQMLARLDALDEKRSAGTPAEQRAAQKELVDLAAGPDAAPFVKALSEVRTRQDDAMVQLETAVDALRTGTTLDGSQPRMATNTSAGLNKQAEAAKQAYIQAALEEAAVRRKALGDTAVSTDEVLKTASTMNDALDELITRAQSKPINDALIVENSPAVMRSGRLIQDGAPVFRKGDPRELSRRPFAKYRAAAPVIFEQVDQARQALMKPAPRRADKPLLRTQFAQTEAKKAPQQRGETAKTPAGKDRIETEFVENQLDKLAIQGKSPSALRAALDKFPTRSVREAVRDIADALLAGRTPSPAERRALTEAVASAKEAKNVGEDTQRNLFDTAGDKSTQRTLAERIASIDERLAALPKETKNVREAANILRRRASLEGAREVLVSQQAEAAANTEAKKEAGAAYEAESGFTRATTANFLRALDSSPEVKKAKRAMQQAKETTAALKEPFKRLDAEAATDAKIAPYVAQVAEAQKRIDTAQADIDAIERAQNDGAYGDMADYKAGNKRIMAMRGEIEDAQKQLDLITSGRYDTAQKATAARAQAAVADKARQDAKTSTAKARVEQQDRLAKGLGLPNITPAEAARGRKLQAQIAAIEDNMNVVPPKLQDARDTLAQTQAIAEPDAKVKRKIRDLKKRIELLEDAEGARQVRMQERRQRLAAQLDAHRYTTPEQRAADRAAALAEQGRGTALDDLAVQPVRPGKRATSPVTRSQPVTQGLRGATEETRPYNATERRVNRGPRLEESRTPNVRNVAISKSEMQKSNEEAARLKALSPKERAKQAREARAVADEMLKSAKKAERGSRLADAVDDIDFDVADIGDTGLDFGDEVLFREDSTFYEQRDTAPLSTAAANEAKAGQLNTVLERLQSEGSTPFVRDTAARLAPLLQDTKLQVVGTALDASGARVEGLYAPSQNLITLDAGALSEEVVVHEATHAATLAALDATASELTPAQFQARAELQQLFDEVQTDPQFQRAYARKDLKEFVAELMSDQSVRDRLDSRGNLLTRIYNSIMRLLGLRSESEKAVENARKLFQPSKSFQPKGAGVASVLRGTFPNTGALYNEDVPESLRTLADTTVGREPTMVDKLLANLSGIALRTQFVDRFAPIERLLQQGVERGVLTDAQSLQTQYFLRFGEHRNQFVEQAASHAVPQLHKTSDGDFVIEAPAGEHANLSKIAKILHNANVGNEQATERLFTDYLTVLRAEQVGYDKLGYDPLITPAQGAEIKRFVAADPQRKQAFDAARAMYREYNHSLMDLMQQTGALSKTEAARLKATEYVPFYRENNGIVQLVVGSEQVVRIGNIADQPYLKELVGSNKRVLPFFTGALQNTSMLVDMALRNQQTKDVSMTMHSMGVATIGNGDGPNSPDVVRFKIDGERKFARVEDAIEEYGIPAELLVKGMTGIKTTLPAALRLLQIPSNWLRKTITRAPAYAIRQVLREPINAWLVSGGNFTPVVSSVKELTKMVRGQSEFEGALERAGAISSNVITGDTQDQVRILRDISEGKTTLDKVLATADKFALQGDAATRAVLYDVYRKKGMTHMQALLGSLESMNFARRGLSPSMHMMALLVPFFNAQVQGMDVIYRALAGNTTLEKQMDVRRKLLKRGLLVAAGTMAYAALMEDDESYKNATPQQRALNWFIPIPGTEETLRMPIPFELGYLFKALPEMFVNVAHGDEKASDAMKAFGSLAYQTVPFGLPQALKPAIEVATNYSFFTGQNVESGREKGLTTAERSRDNTTEMAKLLGKAGALSPIQIDYLMRGYFGGLGLTVMSIPNFALRPFNTADNVELPAKPLNQMPLLGPLFQPRDGRAAIDAAYEEVDTWQQAHNTFQKILAQGRRADALKFAQEHARDMALNSAGGAFKQQMGELAKLRRAAGADSSLSPDQKRERIDQIRQLEIQLSRRVREYGQPS
jgi:hypothetical protein